jgi:hypothetical protein
MKALTFVLLCTATKSKRKRGLTPRRAALTLVCRTATDMKALTFVPKQLQVNQPDPGHSIPRLNVARRSTAIAQTG